MASITSTAQWSTRINQVIFAVLDVSWTMGLNSDKTSKVFFVLIGEINRWIKQRTHSVWSSLLIQQRYSSF